MYTRAYIYMYIIFLFFIYIYMYTSDIPPSSKSTSVFVSASILMSFSGLNLGASTREESSVSPLGCAPAYIYIYMLIQI